jgi:hypothetical protein
MLPGYQQDYKQNEYWNIVDEKCKDGLPETIVFAKNIQRKQRQESQERDG